MNGIDGLFPYCKDCNISKSRKWADKNHERKSIYHKKRNSKTNYKRENNARDRKWRQKNKKRKREYQLNYQRENKDKIKRYNVNHSTHEITNSEWENCLIYFDYSCAYCGIHQVEAKEKQGNLLHKEHVVHNGSDDLSNCIPACKSCNSKKWIYSIEQWYNNSNGIYNDNRNDKIFQWLNKEHKKYIED